MITPADSPSSPSGYASVAVSQTDIQAPLMDGEIAAAFDSANALGGAGALYPQGPRQAEAEALLNSPQGSGAMDVTAGWTGDWPANVEPGG